MCSSDLGARERADGTSEVGQGLGTGHDEEFDCSGDRFESPGVSNDVNRIDRRLVPEETGQRRGQMVRAAERQTGRTGAHGGAHETPLSPAPWMASVSPQKALPMYGSIRPK